MNIAQELQEVSGNSDESLEFRDMSLEDIDAVLEIGVTEQYFTITDEARTTNGFWPRSTLERWVLSKNDVSLVVKLGNRITGFALTTVHPTNRKAEMENLWIHPEWRGGIVSQMLLDATLSKIRGNGSADVIVALVEDGNKAAQSFFLKRGLFTKGKSHVWMTRRIKD